MATGNKRQRDDVDLAGQEHARSVRPDQDGERKHDAHRNRTDAADPARIERVAISSLVPDPANVRKHGAKNLDAIKGSLARFGQQKPIVVSAAGVVVAGNGTLAAAVALGWTEIDVVRSPLVGSEATAYAIADNRTAELAEWDDDALAQTLAALAIDDAALAEATGFDANEIDNLTRGEIDEDEAPEPPVDAVTKTGDVWLLGEHRVMCGDSTSVDDVTRLMRGETAQLMFTDPPYGVGYTGGVQFDGKGGAVTDNREALASDNDAGIYAKFLPVALPFLDGACYVWFVDIKTLDVFTALKQNAVDVRCVIVWNKTNATYAAMNSQYKHRYEPLVYGIPKGASVRWCGATTEATVWDHDRDGINTFHPTQKPVCLAARALGNHNVSLVFDPFLGSGSTLIAAEQLGRKCYGMEISPQYCDVIVKRWETLTGKTATLEAP